MRNSSRLICAVFAALLILIMAVPSFAAGDIEITRQPQHATYPEYSIASYSVEAAGSNLHYTWFIVYEDVIYDTSRMASGVERQPWADHTAEGFTISNTGNEFYFEGILSGLNGAQIYCEISNGVDTVKSSIAHITVGGPAMPPTLSVPSSVTVDVGTPVDLYCAATTHDFSTTSYLWYESSSMELRDIVAIDRGSETENTLHCDTDTVGTRYYACMVTTSEGGQAYTNIIPVTVREKPAEADTDKPSGLTTAPDTDETPADTETPDSQNDPTETDPAAPDTAPSDQKTGGLQWWMIVVPLLAVLVIASVTALVVVLLMSRKNKNRHN